MLCTQHNQGSSLQRRCLSYTDLTHAHWPAEEPRDRRNHSYDSASDSDGENPQPIKRSRSDQSLSATAQVAAAAAAVGRSSSGSGGSSGQSYGVAQQLGCVALSGAPSSYQQPPQYARAQRVPSLPVVLSDVGSSTNSLLSLDSEATRSTSQQHLHMMQGIAGADSPAAASAAAQLRGGQPLARSISSGTAEAALSQQQGAVTGPAAADSSGSQPHAGSRQHSSSGFVCSLNPVSSAASLTQAQLWARGYDMPRNTSDASLSSGGYSAALQQLGLPLTAYSPPPLLSPGPTSLGADRSIDAAAGAAASDALGLCSSSAGPFQPGLSIQHQKQASFQGPPVPAGPHAADQGVFVSAALGSSSWGMRAVNSRDSLHSSESITSVEAGERLAGVRFGLHPNRAGPAGHQHHLSPSQQLKQGQPSGVGAGAAPQLPPLSPAGAQNAGSSSGVGNGSSSSRAAAQQQQLHGGSPAGSGMQAWGSGGVTRPGLASEPSESNMSLLAGASPAIELQSMGSVLGGDGQWLLGELSTGAIGALSPVGAALREEGQQQEQQQQAKQAVQQPQTSVAMAAPVPNSRLFPGMGSSMAAASCSLPVMPGGSAGGFGFGFAAAPGGAAAAAAAAKQCLFADSAFASAAGNGVPQQQQQQSGAPPAASSAFTSFVMSSNGNSNGSGSGSSRGPIGGYGKGVSAPLPCISSTPGRSSLCGTPGSAAFMQAQGLHQPYRPSQHDASQWAFSRRGASLDYARTSLSSRRRGSLELNMPWRKTLDAAIARAAAESSGADAATDDSPCSSEGADSGNTDTDAAVETAASEAEATFGSGVAVVAPSWQRQRPGSQLDLLMPLPEADDESAPVSPCVCGPGSIGPGSMISAGGRGSYDGDGELSSPESNASARGADSASGSAGGGGSGRTSSSGNSVAADHDLPGSTNIGGYIGGSDSLGLARHSLDSPRAAAARALQVQQEQPQQRPAAAAAADSYGLEFDGAVMMQAPLSPGVALMRARQQQASGQSLSALQQQQQQHNGSSAVSLHTTQAQEQVKVVLSSAEVMSSVEGGESSSDDEDDEGSSADEADGVMHLSSRSSAHHHQQQQQQQQQGLAGKRSAPDVPRGKAAGGDGDGAQQFAPPSALGVDGPMPLELQSWNSASSISSRGSPGFYSRRGAGNGASRDLELFVRLNRARQTMDFAKRQAQVFSELDKAELTVWQALDLLDGLREYEAGLLHAAASSGSGGGSAQETDAQLTPDMSLKEHAFQVAELCRLSFPDKPWMALVGLLHGLGKLLAHPLWGSQPQWAVAGESFPVGCKFAPQISASEFFSANPDRRRRTYSTAVGVYQEGCGLRNVYMSWGAAEYLYMLLVLNQTALPEEALFMIRYQRCYAMTRPGGAYRCLMAPEDRALLPTLATFQSILAYKRMGLPAGALQGQALYDHYDGLINAYLGEEALFW